MKENINEQSVYEYIAEHQVDILGRKYMSKDDVINMIVSYFVEKEIGVILASICKTLNEEPLGIFKTASEAVLNDARKHFLFDNLEKQIKRTLKEKEENGCED